MDNQERKQKIQEWLEILKSGEYRNPTHVLDTTDRPDTSERMFITSVYPPSMREAPQSVREWLGLDETNK